MSVYLRCISSPSNKWCVTKLFVSRPDASRRSCSTFIYMCLLFFVYDFVSFSFFNKNRILKIVGEIFTIMRILSVTGCFSCCNITAIEQSRCPLFVQFSSGVLAYLFQPPSSRFKAVTTGNIIGKNSIFKS